MVGETFRAGVKAWWVRRVSGFLLCALLVTAAFTVVETVQGRTGWQVATGAGRPGFFTVTKEAPHNCGARGNPCDVVGYFVPDDTGQELAYLQVADDDLGVHRLGERTAGEDLRGTVYRPNDDHIWRIHAFLAWLGVMVMTAILGLLVRHWRFGPTLLLHRFVPQPVRRY
ncbi:hypothetical protein [Kitasatospora sp. NPDC048407]|uniref:hypothetical protein n=1 Tax=Kitasatospora sp. NPDC048407 TaxID=3364051 RepID=UPI00371FA6EB